MHKEIELRKDFLNGELIETIYFGGGTPSILEEIEVNNLIIHLKETFDCSNLEVTIEANPDDISLEKLNHWHSSGINRISLGIQSFHQKALEFMNRCHSKEEALNSIKLIQAHDGFDNVSLDLIFGIQCLSYEEFLTDLNQLIALKPNHLSTYCLTIEENTVFGKWYEKGNLNAVDEHSSSKQYLEIINRLTKSGYDQYEISNFSLPGKKSLHNYSYWNNSNYLGLGPSAHSYNGNSRLKNISNNAKYIKALENNTSFFEIEVLDKNTKINEYLLTKLRTSEGVDLDFIKDNLSVKSYNYLLSDINRLNEQGLTSIVNRQLKLSLQGKLLADMVCEKLFIV